MIVGLRSLRNQEKEFNLLQNVVKNPDQTKALLNRKALKEAWWWTQHWQQVRISKFEWREEFLLLKSFLLILLFLIVSLQNQKD